MVKVVFGVSWPIPYKNPQRKLFFNSCFQVNYAEPFSLSSFYNATYFQNIYDARHHLNDKSEIFTKNTEHTADNSNATPAIDDTQSERIVERDVETEQSGLIGSDLTAAQLYESIENNFRE